jgi:hypothetical protein
MYLTIAESEMRAMPAEPAPPSAGDPLAMKDNEPAPGSKGYMRCDFFYHMQSRPAVALALIHMCVLHACRGVTSWHRAEPCIP